MNWQHIGILALFDLRHSLLRLKGLVFLIPFLLFWYGILKLLLEKGATVLVSTESLLILSWILNPDIARTLLILHPPSISVFFLVTLATAPGFALLAANDQVAGDAGSKSLRYLMTRCTRTEIFLARFAGSYGLMAIGIAIIGTLAILISLVNDQHPPARILAYGLQVNLLILAYLLPLVAYMSAISALMSSALASLLAGAFIYVLLVVLNAYLNHYLPVDISLLPGGMKDYLLTMNSADIILALAGFLAYTAIFSVLGWWLFRRRNI